MDTREGQMDLESHSDQTLTHLDNGIKNLTISNNKDKLLEEPLNKNGDLDPITFRFNQLASTFTEHLKAQNYGKIEEIIAEIRKVTSTDNPPVEQLVNTGIIPDVISFLDPKFYECQNLLQECSWIICNVSSGTSEHVEFLISLGAIPKVLQLLSYPNQSVFDSAIWTLANIAGTTLTFRDLLIDNDIVNKLLIILDGNFFSPSLLVQVSWLVSNLCRGRPYPPPDKVTHNSFILSFLKMNRFDLYFK